MGISNFRFVILNSTILFIVACILQMTLHEFGHFFAAIIVHARGISVHHNYVDNIDEGLPLRSILLIKGAGPFVSLMIGIVFHLACSVQKNRNLIFLFKLYMSMFGYIGFFGYLTTTPIFAGGDTGYICAALHFPLWLNIMIAVSGAILLYLIVSYLMEYYVEMATRKILEKRDTRFSFIHSILLLPVLYGIPFTTLLNLPVMVILSLIAPFFGPFTFLWGYGNALSKNYKLKSTNVNFEELNKLNYVLITLLIITIFYNRMLVKGIYYN
ncbi:MAG TPA: hypothetical protein VK711_16005 [Puia sp.]|jgi:hypothetical protein|nr:hypothetical protein [Puia sp.]